MAAAAAPAMLCYVTRPDAVLMEVEVEAKANGEDCLNQVRTKGQAGTLGRGASRRRRAPGTHRLPGAGRRCCGGGRWGERVPGAPPAPPTPRAWGAWAPSWRAQSAWGTAEDARSGRPPCPPPPPPARHFPGRRRPRTSAAGVCLKPPVGSPRGLPATPASRDEVVGGGHRSLGLLGGQAGPLSLAASQMGHSPASPDLRGREDRFGVCSSVVLKHAFLLRVMTGSNSA